MFKRVLIISPHFPPVNAADMHRVRQLLPYLKANGWEAEVLAVNPVDIETYSSDELLSASLPNDLQLHYVRAWDVQRTRKFGLGSLSMRSFFQYKKKGNALLKSGKFDVVFFSTTAFHVMALGPYWKKKFKIPFVLDIQDPWRNDFYLNQPKAERPPKFMIAYTIDKYLEARTVPYADAIISVSKAYCETFAKRYTQFQTSTCTVIPFGGVPNDFKVVDTHHVQVEKVKLDPHKINLVYVGRGGHDMKYILQCFFKAVAAGLHEAPAIFSKLHCWFIGTSYAMEGRGAKTIAPLANELQLQEVVTEITDRIPYYETLALLKKADLLFVPGSTDTGYTASKIYPYVLAEKPLLACFHQKSSVVQVLKAAKAGELICFDHEKDTPADIEQQIFAKLKWLLENLNQKYTYDPIGFEPYTAEVMTQKIATVFNQVIQKR